MKLAEKIKQLIPKGYNRVLLVKIPEYSEDVFDVEVALKQRYACLPPYGLGIISQNLDARGYITDIIDLNFDVLYEAKCNSKGFKYSIWKDKLKNKIQDFKPDVIGISCMYSMAHKELKKVSNFIKQETNLPIIAGGLHSTTAAEHVLKDCRGIDFICLYEGDNPLFFSDSDLKRSS